MSVNLYRSILTASQQRISTEMDLVVQSVPHSGEKGYLVEECFRRALADILPERIGVSHGFVVDSEGNESKQMDVVLYDKPNSPMVLASEGAQLFPVEATIACGEVKSKLDSKELRKALFFQEGRRSP